MQGDIDRIGAEFETPQSVVSSKSVLSRLLSSYSIVLLAQHDAQLITGK